MALGGSVNERRAKSRVSSSPGKYAAAIVGSLDRGLVSVVEDGRVGDADDRALRCQPSDRLAPWLLARGMQQLVAGLLKFSCRGADRGGIGHIELDADLRYQPSCRPLVGPEARLGGLRQSAKCRTTCSR